MGREWFEGHKENPIEMTLTTTSDQFELIKQSAAMTAYPWQSKDKYSNVLLSYTKLMSEHFPSVPKSYLAQYVHDILVFDQGLSLPAFFQNAIDLKKLYNGEELVIALRTLAKTYWIKDEVFVSHLMISPMKLQVDKEKYQEFGSSYEVVHINRPAFEVLGRKIEFDFSPKPWMLRVMRHFRILRKLMPAWHQEERKIADSIRRQLLEKAQPLKHLKELDSIKGYRQYRYLHAAKFLGEKV
jgi:indolepyruvate ferredoxin oxidoreductase